MTTNALTLAVLEALSRRGLGSGYALVDIPGAPVDEVEAMITKLWRAGCVDAWRVPPGFGPEPERVTPSQLTTKGHQYLQSLRDQSKGGA
jgi:hypothetical protein